MIVFVDGSTTVVCYIINGKVSVVPALGNSSKVTVNEGEYYAVIHALEELKRLELQNEPIRVHSDSELLVKQLSYDNFGSSIYRVKARNLKVLRQRVLELTKDFYKVSFKWIPREHNPAGHVLEQGVTSCQELD